jgi:hypothetical protein
VECVPFNHLKYYKGDIQMSYTERFKVKGGQLVEKVTQLIHEGNVRRVRLIHKDRTMLEIPLSIGAPAAAITIMAAPVLAAIGAFAALVTECTIEVEKIEESPGKEGVKSS